MKLVLAAKSLPLKAINGIMKRLLFPLLAALAFPTAVKAESAYLVVRTTTSRMMQENGQLMFFSNDNNG